MKRRLQPRLVVYSAVLFLAGCYTPQQDRHYAEMSAIASNGVPTRPLVSLLGDRGFACSRSSDPNPKYDCARTKQNLLPPYSCVERVRFVDVAGTAMEVDIPPVACAGL